MSLRPRRATCHRRTGRPTSTRAGNRATRTRRSAGSRSLRAMAAVLTAAMVAVVAYCAMRLVVPARRDDDHPLELDVLHVVMGTVMIAMLVDVLPTNARTAVIA